MLLFKCEFLYILKFKIIMFWFVVNLIIRKKVCLSPLPFITRLYSELCGVVTGRNDGLVTFEHFGYLNWSFFLRKFIKKGLLSTKPQSIEEVRRFMFHWWDYKSLRAVTIPCHILFYPLDIFQYTIHLPESRIPNSIHLLCIP